MIVFKENVRIKTYSPALCWILNTLYQLDQNRPVCAPEIITITSINDSLHMEGSRHYSDEAIDIRSKNFSAKIHKMTFIELFKNMLNSHPALPGKFSILFEGEGTDNEHFHVQVKKGQKFEWV